MDEKENVMALISRTTTTRKFDENENLIEEIEVHEYFEEKYQYVSPFPKYYYPYPNYFYSSGSTTTYNTHYVDPKQEGQGKLF
jgi:biotin synthase-related radical SAM superfamily protein